MSHIRIHRRKALTDLRATVDANGMYMSQKEWGGSHDVILGEMVWLLDMPVYPMAAAYRSDHMRTGVLNNIKNRYTRLLYDAILVHDVIWKIF